MCLMCVFSSSSTDCSFLLQPGCGLVLVISLEAMREVGADGKEEKHHKRHLPPLRALLVSKQDRAALSHQEVGEGAISPSPERLEKPGGPRFSD